MLTLLLIVVGFFVSVVLLALIPDEKVEAGLGRLLIGVAMGIVGLALLSRTFAMLLGSLVAVTLGGLLLSYTIMTALGLLLYPFWALSAYKKTGSKPSKAQFLDCLLWVRSKQRRAVTEEADRVRREAARESRMIARDRREAEREARRHRTA
ncbi:hypothetical protein [Caballeronia sp. LZ035]|uniref:hypothetical protein n=1 Tax=Caballeronia sp. LZ035 TaxID=3038568 RepID=UPI00285A45D7|nr:hypothetical protein [Caballeronia sp. LZ035]MDR5758196.1 hypothetical protein [Caballeronia sp. LZ035]